MAAAPAHATTFEGSRQVTGSGAYSQPIGFVPSASAWSADGRGGCTGILNGVDVSDTPVRFRLAVTDPAEGCATVSLATGEGELRFGQRGPRLRFTYRHLGTPVAVHEGRHGGTALGFLTAYTQIARLPRDGLLQCAKNRLKSLPFEWGTQTLSPLVG